MIKNVNPVHLTNLRKMPYNVLDCYSIYSCIFLLFIFKIIYNIYIYMKEFFVLH